MKILTTFLFFLLFQASENIIQIEPWSIEVDLSNSKLSTSNKIEFDSAFSANYITLVLPKEYCNVEKIDVEPTFRILDKYLKTDNLNFLVINNFLDDYLNSKFKILSSQMSPSEFGQNFSYVIEEKDRRFLYNYYLFKNKKKHFIIEYISTFGTKKKNEKELSILLENIRPILN